MNNKSKQVTYIALAGGLGNQLFQLASGLFFSKNSNLIILENMGNPRISSNGNVDLHDFHMPDNVKFIKINRFKIVMSKIFGYLIRQSANSSDKWLDKIARIFFGFCFKVLFLYNCRKLISIYLSKGIGFSKLNIDQSNKFLIGYFQSYKWALEPEVHSYLRQMKLKAMPTEVLNFRKLAEIECPLIIHVRLTDYLLESNFGIPSAKYYENALAKLSALSSIKSIWLFSDDPVEARKYLPTNLKLPLRVFDQINNSSAATLEVMRFGHAYILANSTFGWWGAFLSYIENAPVIVPSPWFDNLTDPVKLIPSDWVEMEKNPQ